jgi:hypothetical protein
MKRLLLLGLVLSGCSFVSSLNSARVEQATPTQAKVTALTNGLLTIASTKVITSIKGTDLQPCNLADTYRGVNHGVICKAIKRDFIITLETLGTVAARVTQ